VEAVKWYRKAAEQNDAEAQCELSRCYALGEGVAIDKEEVVKWSRKAAEQNLAKAQCSLGVCYATGQGVAKDEVEAVKWLRKAADGGEVKAFKFLAGVLATSEDPTIRDGSQAVVFAEKAMAGTNRKNPADLDRLAVAYAAAGQFGKAVSAEQEAIGLLQTEGEKNVCRNRLKLFEAHQPYRAKN
jgi:TPR repeat protein